MTTGEAGAAVRRPARERLLAAADELFYAEGVHSVGIDRVIEHAGVAKATLYSAFGSKDELVRAYLTGRHEAIKAQLTRELEARYRTPRERLVGVFEVRGESLSRPGFRGCAFAAANAEARPGSAAQDATAGYRDWMRSFLRGLAEAAGAADPDSLARQLHLLYDGMATTAWLDHDPSAAAVARSAAQVLVDAAVPASVQPAVG
jgi:AcrR family transcriptional regulator